MKNYIFLTIFLLLFKTGFSQTPEVTSPINDSTSYKNEFGLNILPLVYIVGAATPNTNTRLTLNYRRFLKKKGAFRLSFSILPYPDSYDNNKQNVFYQTTDTFLLFRNTSYDFKPKLQLNTGYEMIFGSEKLIQSFGVEGSVFYQQKSYSETFIWAAKSTYSPSTGMLGSNVGNVDTLGYFSQYKSYGFGIHLFYNLRIVVSPRWCVSLTAGPNFYYSSNFESRLVVKTKTTEESYFSSFNLLPVFLSDLSVCYRF